jgi:hypothetical protein
VALTSSHLKKVKQRKIRRAKIRAEFLFFAAPRELAFFFKVAYNAVARTAAVGTNAFERKL